MQAFCNATMIPRWLVVRLEHGRAPWAELKSDGSFDNFAKRTDAISVVGALGAPVGGPTPAELCRLARRRSGWTLAEIAAAWGASHVTMLKWERAGRPLLVQWWVSSGLYPDAKRIIRRPTWTE